ncbi:MAG: glycosyltransferase [Ignavibacteriales bacterium]|nr:glycosyltransferase [Ignavibacteriales bacterium]
MKILTLIPDGYTLLNTIRQSFKKMNHEVINLNYLSFFKVYQNRLITKTIGLPRTVKNKIKIHDIYREKINQRYLHYVYDYKPDLVFVYNDQYLSYETAKEIRKISNLAFILGDNPFFFHNHPSKELGMYLEADYIFSCDSYLTESFRKAGQPRISEIYFGYDPTICYPKQPTVDEKEKYSNDVVMIGRLYPDILSSWTYKRLWFYNQFRNLNIKIYGHGWHKYKDSFPELMNKVVTPNHYFSFDEMNLIQSCCKVYPVEANPGIINGIHLRVFDCIGTEILPLAEYTKDLESVFKDVEIPIITDYSKAEEIAKYYIKNDQKREQVKKELKQFVDENYTPQSCC